MARRGQEAPSLREATQRRGVHELIAEQVDRTPDAPAVVLGAAQLTYRQLDERADQLARQLTTLGVGRGSIVAVALDRSPELLVSLLGILKTGAAYLPLDLELPRDRWTFIVEDAQPKVLIARADVRLPARHPVEIDPTTARPSLQLTGRVSSPVSGDDLAYLMYTSGSTGVPKGVLVTHGGITNLLLWMQDAFGLDQKDHVLQKTPYFWDVSVPELFGPLTMGAQVVLAEPGRHKDIEHLWSLIDEHAVTTVSFVPSMLRHFLDDRYLRPAPSLKRVLAAGEALSSEIHDRFLSLCNAELHNLYGPTEGTVYATHWACTLPVGGGPVLIGRAIRNTSALVLDELGQEVQPGTVGELHLGGVNVAIGYQGREDLTAERFVRDRRPGQDGRLFRTGDLVRATADGQLEFLGRKDEQVKIYGNRIELGEIESVLLSHPALREAAAAVAEAGTSLIAFIVPQAGREVEDAELRELLERKLPSFMIPAAFYRLPSLPRTPSGKVDRRALHAPERPSEAPGSPLEKELSQLWLKILGKPAGITDNFFEIGGDSLLAAELFCAIERRFQTRLAASTMLRAPTIRSQARVLEKRPAPHVNPPLVALRPSGKGRPLFVMHGLGGGVLHYRNLVDELGVETPVYGLEADPNESPLTRIEDLAARYLAAVRQLQPCGPYRFGGGSFGGNVAFEMARQVEVAGGQVELVALFDAGLGSAALSKPALYVSRTLVTANKLFYHASELVRMDRDRRSDYLRRRWQGILARGRTAWWQLRNRTWEQTGKAPPASISNLVEANWLAIERYLPARPLRAKTVLYRAKKFNELWVLGNDPTFGWSRFANDLEVIQVDGGHSEVLDKPNVTTIAADLQRRIGG
jgi:amino acid adenylation domain-containing protein